MIILKDTAEEFIEQAPIRKIHGETDLILKDVKTGRVDRYHSENTFQAWTLQNYTKRNGAFNTTSGFDWTELVGGLYLFKNQIPVGTEYMPAGNSMTGSGAYGDTNSTQCLEFGNFNGRDSEATASAIRQVYEFDTSMANGDIACVCLGNRTGARIGYGYASGYIQGEYSMNPGYGTNTGRRIGERNQMYYNGFIYSWAGVDENNLAHIYKRRFTGNIGSVFHDIGDTDLTFDMTQIGQPWTDFVSSAYCYTLNAGDVGAGVYRINPYADTHNIAPGADAYYYEFNCATETLTLKTFTNSSNATIYWTGSACRFFSDYIVVRSDGANYEEYACIFRESTGAFLRRIKTYYTFGPQDSNRDLPPSEIADGLIVFRTYESEVRSGGGADTPAWGIYDCVADTFRAIALPWSNPDRHFAVGTRMKNLDIMKNESWAAHDYKFHNPFYLATINNLSETVTKTAAKTMKVIYTLTEV